MNRPSQSTESLARVTKAVVLILLLCAIAAAQETAPISALEVKYRKQIFKDDRFSVFLLEIPPKNASPMHRHNTDMLTVFISGDKTKSTIYGEPPTEIRINAGEVRYRPAGFTHSTENLGSSMFRAVILEFNSSTGAIQPTKPSDSRYCNPGSETTCVDAKYLFCTAKFCVQDLTIGPGAVWRNDENAGDQMLVAVSDYKLSYRPKGKAAKVRKRKSGDVEYFPRGSARQWKNVASEPARVIAVVFR
jgi:quercetin dioxygenase-like cupin family protein